LPFELVFVVMEHPKQGLKEESDLLTLVFQFVHYLPKVFQRAFSTLKGLILNLLMPHQPLSMLSSYGFHTRIGSAHFGNHFIVYFNNYWL